VDFTSYQALLPGVAHPTGQVSALKCLLSERGLYRGRISDSYGRAVRRALSAWRVDHGQIASDTWSRRSWMTLLAAGPTPVVKLGSAGRAVRRVQRSLNAASRPGLTVTGVFDAATDAALRDWQRAVGLDVTGVASADDWAALQSGRR
jgi:peptidoglycan hydrolase-like protein with peptidoglycan-binding domain